MYRNEFRSHRSLIGRQNQAPDIVNNFIKIVVTISSNENVKLRMISLLVFKTSKKLYYT